MADGTERLFVVEFGKPYPTDENNDNVVTEALYATYLSDEEGVKYSQYELDWRDDQTLWLWIHAERDELTAADIYHQLRFYGIEVNKVYDASADPTHPNSPQPSPETTAYVLLEVHSQDAEFVVRGVIIGRQRAMGKLAQAVSVHFNLHESHVYPHLKTVTNPGEGWPVGTVYYDDYPTFFLLSPSLIINPQAILDATNSKNLQAIHDTFDEADYN